MDTTMNLLPGPTPWRAGMSEWSGLATLAVLFMWMHWKFAWCRLPSGHFHKVFEAPQGEGAEKNGGSADENDRRVAEEWAQVQVRAWKFAAHVMVHLHILPILISMRDLQQRADLATMAWSTCSLVSYSCCLLTVTESMKITAARVRVISVVIHTAVLGKLLSTMYESQDDYLGRAGVNMLAQVILALAFPDSEVIVPFAVLFCGAYFVTGLTVCGWKGTGLWFVIQQSLQLAVVSVLPIFAEQLQWERIRAKFQSQDADSLLLAFRQMLRGVCDGDVLLDSDLKICGEARCLNRLLGNPMKLEGCALTDLVSKEEIYAQSLRTFLQSATFSSNGTAASPPCMRVAFKGGHGREVSTDVFHVALPDHFGTNSTYHLLAIMEDAESRLSRVPAADSNPHPLSLAAAAAGPDLSACSSSVSTGSLCSAQSQQTLEWLDQLMQLTLTIDANSPDMDISDVYLRFAPAEDEVSMVNLRGLVRALEWSQVHARLSQLGNEFAQRRPKPKLLHPLALRIPGLSTAHLRARDIEVRSAFTDRRPRGQPAFIYMTMTNFKKTKHNSRRRPMYGLAEDEEAEQSAEAVRGA